MDKIQAIKEARARFNHQQSKLQLESKYSNQLIVAHNGGLFRATPELMGYLSSKKKKSVILIDEYRNPVEVNSSELLEELDALYTEIMSSWYEEYNKLKNLKVDELQ